MLMKPSLGKLGKENERMGRTVPENIQAKTFLLLPPPRPVVLFPYDLS